MKFRNILKMIIGVSLLIILIYSIGLKKIVLTFSEFKLFLIIPVLLLDFLVFYLGAINIKFLVRIIGKKIRMRSLYKYYVLSWSYATFTPGKLGEFSLAWYLTKNKFTYGEGGAVILIDKSITLLVTLGLSLFAVLFLDKKIVLITAGLFFLALIIFFSILSLKKIRDLIRRFILKKYSEKFRRFYRTIMLSFTKGYKLLILNFFITIAKSFVQALITLVMFIGFDVKISFSYIIVITAITTLISLIPISFSGLGLREYSAIELFGLVGVPSAVTLSVYLIFLIMRYIMSSLFIIMIKND